MSRHSPRNLSSPNGLDALKLAPGACGLAFLLVTAWSVLTAFLRVGSSSQGTSSQGGSLIPDHAPYAEVCGPEVLMTFRQYVECQRKRFGCGALANEAGLPDGGTSAARVASNLGKVGAGPGGAGLDRAVATPFGPGDHAGASLPALPGGAPALNPGSKPSGVPSVPGAVNPSPDVFPVPPARPNLGQATVCALLDVLRESLEKANGLDEHVSRAEKKVPREWFTQPPPFVNEAHGDRDSLIHALTPPPAREYAKDLAGAVMETPTHGNDREKAHSGGPTTDAASLSRYSGPSAKGNPSDGPGGDDAVVGGMSEPRPMDAETFAIVEEVQKEIIEAVLAFGFFVVASEG